MKITAKKAEEIKKDRIFQALDTALKTFRDEGYRQGKELYDLVMWAKDDRLREIVDRPGKKESHPRKVYLDSLLHYQLKQDGDKLLFLEYGTGDPDDENYDACPKMEHREAFQPSEGRVIEQFVEGEQVEFIYSSFDSKITSAYANDRVSCGDDLKFELTEPGTESSETEQSHEN